MGVGVGLGLALARAGAVRDGQDVPLPTPPCPCPAISPPQVQCVTDEIGFVLFDRSAGPPSIDRFGPYCVEQYLVMELLSKQAPS